MVFAHLSEVIKKLFYNIKCLKTKQIKFDTVQDLKLNVKVELELI